jgi:hypothetical protein
MSLSNLTIQSSSLLTPLEPNTLLLSPGCDLDLILQNLPYKKLLLTHCQLTSPGVSGHIGDPLDTDFRRLKLNPFILDIRVPIITSQVSINRPDFVFRGNVDVYNDRESLLIFESNEPRSALILHVAKSSKINIFRTMKGLDLTDHDITNFLYLNAEYDLDLLATNILYNWSENILQLDLGFHITGHQMSPYKMTILTCNMIRKLDLPTQKLESMICLKIQLGSDQSVVSGIITSLESWPEFVLSLETNTTKGEAFSLMIMDAFLSHIDSRIQIGLKYLQLHIRESTICGISTRCAIRWETSKVTSVELDIIIDEFKEGTCRIVSSSIDIEDFLPREMRRLNTIRHISVEAKLVLAYQTLYINFSNKISVNEDLACLHAFLNIGFAEEIPDLTFGAQFPIWDLEKSFVIDLEGNYFEELDEWLLEGSAVGMSFSVQGFLNAIAKNKGCILQENILPEMYVTDPKVRFSLTTGEFSLSGTATLERSILNLEYVYDPLLDQTTLYLSSLVENQVNIRDVLKNQKIIVSSQETIGQISLQQLLIKGHEST